MMSEKPKYVLAVPNFSEGRNAQAIEAAVSAVKAVATVRVVAVEPEANFNRTVLTFICEPQHAVEAMVALAGAVYRHVNMEVQKGVHPRIGALDTAPVFPLKNISIEEVKDLAEAIGHGLHAAYKVPVFFSGLNARTEYKKSNTNIRKGQYEGLKAILETPGHPDRELRMPDLSLDGRLSATMGAVTVSADYEGLTAYNVFIDSEDPAVPNAIAKVVKDPQAGWSSIKAIGFKDVQQPGTAVSMNVFDAAHTPLAMLRDFVEDRAQASGHRVIGTQIVGPVKYQYLLDSAKLLGYQGDPADCDGVIRCLTDAMKLIDFHKQMIIESHLA